LKLPHISDPQVADTDGDGINDGDEVFIGTNPTDNSDAETDTDSDNLTDFDEVFTYGTNPTVADTDGDGLTDDIEIILGTDPLDSDTDADGLSDGNEDVNSNGIADCLFTGKSCLLMMN